jgi:hypothetical protein
VIITREEQDEIIEILNKHLQWIKDEWESNPSGFKLFSISSGILKTSIDINNAENSTFKKITNRA